MSKEPELIFRKDLYFYRMAAAASASLTACALLFNPENPAQFKPGDWVALTGIATGDRHFFPHDVHREAIAGNFSKDDYLAATCVMLANTAYESVKDRRDQSFEFEFFRHIRNAASHGNRFNFYPKEPERPASWRGIALDHSSKGTSNPLHDTICFGRLLGVPDVFLLLWDIEQRLIEQDSVTG